MIIYTSLISKYMLIIMNEKPLPNKVWAFIIFIGYWIYLYQNKYILSKIIFLNFKYLQGFAPHPTSFVAAYEVRLRREAKRLYLNLNVINYFTCKTILVLFSTNFILALFGSFCGGKKNNKKLTNLKIFSIHYY